MPLDYSCPHPSLDDSTPLPLAYVPGNRCSSFATDRETLNARASSLPPSHRAHRCLAFSLSLRLAQGYTTRCSRPACARNVRDDERESHVHANDTNTPGKVCDRALALSHTHGGNWLRGVFTSAVRRYFKRSPHRHLPPPLNAPPSASPLNTPLPPRERHQPPAYPPDRTSMLSLSIPSAIFSLNKIITPGQLSVPSPRAVRPLGPSFSRSARFFLVTGSRVHANLFLSRRERFRRSESLCDYFER